MLERDVENLSNYFGQYAPELLTTQYGKEIWALYEHGELLPDTPLTGRFVQSNKPVDLNSVMREIEDAKFEEAARLLRMQEAEL
jgi:RIO kinase 1